MSFNRSAQNVQLTGGNLIIVDTDKKIRSSKYEFADGGSDGAGTSVNLQDVTEQGASTDRTVTFSNVTTALIVSSNVNTTDRLAFRQTRYGWSSSYKVLQYGNCAAESSISLGYDPIGNGGSQFTGNEIIIPYDKAIIAPTSDDTGYVGILRLASSNILQIGGSSYTTAGHIKIDQASGNVYIGTDSPDTTYLPKLQVTDTSTDGTGGILITSYKPALKFFDQSAGTPASYGIFTDSDILTFEYDANQNGTFTPFMQVNTNQYIEFNTPIKSYDGINTGAGTYTNYWQRIISFEYSRFNFESCKIIMNLGGDTSNDDTCIELDFTFKNQNFSSRAALNISVSGPNSGYSESNFEILKFDDSLGDSSNTIDLYANINRNYTIPTYTVIGNLNNSNVAIDTPVLTLPTSNGVFNRKFINLKQAFTSSTSGGNFGIGTGNPGHKLDVVGTTRTSNIIVNSTNGTGSLSSGTLTLDFDSKSYKTFVVAADSATISTITIQNAIDGSQGVVDLRPRGTSDVDIFRTIAPSTIKTSLYSNALINSASHCLISTFTLSGNTFVSFSEYT